MVVEVFITQAGVTGSGLDLEDTLLDGQEGDIEGSSTEIENEHIALADHLLVETVRHSSSRGLVDNTKDVHARDGTSVLGSLSLRVVEVRGDSDNSIIDGVTQVRLSSLLHLEEHHGRNLFRGKLLGLTPVFECRVSPNTDT